ncbi:MAG TPA: DUF1223 domain-containing protein [Candidatus Angelobacter sp.]|nr:DUF1223 domain-containing protein [Candidatus Angelobacter sp.]
MKRLLQGTILLVLIFLLGAFVLKPPSPPAAQRKAVVIELFTSEGCSSCPPADALLGNLGNRPSANGAEIIPLGFHVDYWDYQGWRDRFGSHSYTERQQKYAARFQLDGPYTPQLVVDGQTELVGSDSARAQNAIIQAAARQQQTDVQLSWKAPDRLLVLATTGNTAASSQVLLAITENELASNVAAGENGGHVLHHSAVVRDFRLLGRLNNGRLQVEIPVKAAADWKVKDLRLVVFVQSAPLGPIEGAAAIPWSKADDCKNCRN